MLGPDDTQRHRLRVTTDAGTDCAIALARSDSLCNGAVLLLEHARAIVVRMKEQSWLDLQPRDTAAALEIGYWIGNLHWRVEFAGTTIRIALDGPEQAFLDRLAPYLADGRIRLTGRP